MHQHSSGSHPLKHHPAALSKALERIVGGGKQGVRGFFEEAWQIKPAVFAFRGEDEEETFWDDEAVKRDVVKAMVDQGWNVVVAMLHAAQDELKRKSKKRYRREEMPEDYSVISGQNQPQHHVAPSVVSAGLEGPLIFQIKQLLEPEQANSKYGVNNFFSPYLDDCSVVINHKDLISPHIAALCQDVQGTFPHAYANTYLTPPRSQAVPPHADD